MPSDRAQRRQAARERARRRRLGALLCIGVLALVVGAAVGASHDEGERERRSVGAIAPNERRSAPPAGEPAAAGSRESAARGRESAARGRASAARPATAREPRSAAGAVDPLVALAGRTIVMRFAGTSVPRYVLTALREKRAAGVILFRDNVTSSAQVKRMTRAMQRAARGRALLMIDQEGGTIRILRFAPPATAPPSLDTAAEARAQGAQAARTLRTHGFNVNLAPVADVANTRGSVMRSRAFPGGDRAVGRLVAANVGAYDKTGVLPTLKHFPGLGRSRVNTDFGLATVPGGGELGGFQPAITAGVPLVMSSHALYPDLDRNRIASQSRRILVDLLRERMKFRGVVVTDSLEAQAVVRRTSTPVAATRSMAAGNDLLLTTGPGSYLRVLRAVVAKARRDPAFRARLRQAERRVAALPR